MAKDIRLSDNQDEEHQIIRRSGKYYHLISWYPDNHYLIFCCPDDHYIDINFGCRITTNEKQSEVCFARTSF